MQRLRHVRLVAAGAGMLLLLLSAGLAGAATGNISHSYKPNGTIPNGSLVSLDPQHPDYVEAANTENSQRLLGVAVDPSNDSLLAVDPSTGLAQVATSGTANVLVSTVNGDIKVGDQIAASPFNGVGMKASEGTYVVGLAQTAFNKGSAGATTEEATELNGKKTQVVVGYIRVSIAIGTANTAAQLNALQRLGKSLTGHIISTPRMIISLIVAVVAVASLVTLIYASIYGSIISIGRNPLAKFAIFRTLGSVLGMAFLTASVAALTIFFLLH